MPQKKYRTKEPSIDSFIIAIIDAIIALWFFAFYGSYLLIKAIVTRRPIEKHSLKQQKAFKRNFVGIILIAGLIALGAYFGSPAIIIPFSFIGLIIILILSLKYLRRRHERQLITSDIDKHLHRALEVMDTTARWYNNEDEANRELVSCLKSQNIDATYQYILPSGRTADAKVGNVLIEGKLSPDTAGIDRLLGQLNDYTQYGDKVNVVIYGQLDKEARRRIENEIHLRYTGRVFLAYLNNPRRQRAPSAI